jgi:hypothetical protein
MFRRQSCAIFRELTVPDQICYTIQATKFTHLCCVSSLLEVSSDSVSMGNTLQDLPLLCETANNTERYI